MRLKLYTLSLPVLFIVSGCSTLSGYDASSDFSCNAPIGVSCESISGVHANVKAKKLPSQNPNTEIGHLSLAASKKQNEEAYSSMNSEHSLIFNEKQEDRHAPKKHFHQSQIIGTAPLSGTPLYQSPNVIRIWFAPFESSSGVLNDQSYSYIVIQKEGWQIEHLKKSIKMKGQSSIHSLNERNKLK